MRGEDPWRDVPGRTRGESLTFSPIVDGDQFRMRTVTVDADGRVTEGSSFTEPFKISTRSDLGIADRKCVIESPGDFSYLLDLQGFVFGEIEAQGLPAGVGLADSPPRLAGTASSGDYDVVISGITGRHRRAVKLEMIVTAAPRVVSPIGTISATPAAPDVTIDLNDVFTDPDSETIVRMNTVLGDIDIALFKEVSPLTVASFLGYVDSGALDGTFIHNNSVADPFSILQAGRYIPRDDGKLQEVPLDPAASPADFDALRSNVCGTIAMLKPVGDRATNQWLFNYSDNSGDLDKFYGAFGRVMGDGMSIVTAISDLPVTSANAATVVSCNGTPPNEKCNEALLGFKDWPLLRIREEGLDTDDLVAISRITRVPPLSFALISNSAPTVASVGVSDSGEMSIDYLAQGQANVEVKATDRDGVTTSHAFTIAVGERFETWAVLAGLAGDQASLTANPDNDEFNNLLEYAFGGNPNQADSEWTGVGVSQGTGKVPAITFFYRSAAADLEYLVELSADLAGQWGDVWNSTQGLDDPKVLRKEDIGGGMMKVTVAAPDATLPAFLRVSVSNH